MEEKRSLLLVEDEVIIAMAEKLQLEKRGYRVLHVFSGEDSVRIIRSKEIRFDLVLMDIDLGKGLDGITAARKILEFADIPIVFLSSHTESEFVQKMEQITSYGYVDKNSGITVLDASIKMAFKLFSLKQDIRNINSSLVNTNRKLNVFLSICQRMTSMFELVPLMQFIVDGAIEATNANSGAVYLVDSQKLLLVAANPVLQKQYPISVREASLNDHPHIKKAVTSGKHVIMRDCTKTILTSAEREIIKLRNLVSNLYLPIHFGNQVIGVLILSSTTDIDIFDNEDILMLQGFADQAAQVINNIRSFETLKESVSGMDSFESDSDKIEDNIRFCEESQRYFLMNRSDNNFDMLTLSDFAGNIQLGCAKNSLKHSLDDIIGNNILDYVHPEDIDPVKRVISGLALNKITSGHKYRFKRPDGNYVWFESSAIVLRDKFGNPQKLLLCINDLSQSKLS